MLCYCEGHCPDDQQNGTCVAKKGSQCFAAVEAVYFEETKSWEPTLSYGCLPPEEGGLMQVHNLGKLFFLRKHKLGSGIMKCDLLINKS